MKRRRESLGFNLVELMVVLAITGLVTRMAALSLSDSIRQTKTSEVVNALDRIAKGAAAYRSTEFFGRNAEPLPRRFPDTVDMTPSRRCCDFPSTKCPSDPAAWSTQTWVALGFSIDQDHYYNYEFVSEGSEESSTFAAIARGDLDCDGVITTWINEGSINADGNIAMSGTRAIGAQAE